VKEEWKNQKIMRISKRHLLSEISGLNICVGRNLTMNNNNNNKTSAN